MTALSWIAAPLFDIPVTPDDFIITWNAGDNEETHVSLKGYGFLEAFSLYADADPFVAWLVANQEEFTTPCGTYSLTWNGGQGFDLTSNDTLLGTFVSVEEAKTTAQRHMEGSQ